MQTEKINENRGGKRPNAGRKPKERKVIKFYLHEENFDIINIIEGNRTEWINKAIRYYYSSLNK